MSNRKQFSSAWMTVASAPGTGNITLGAAIRMRTSFGKQTFLTFVQAGFQDGDTFSYKISDKTVGWEEGEGTYNAGVVTRDTVFRNSLGTTAKLDFTADARIAPVLLSEDVADKLGSADKADQETAEAGVDPDKWLSVEGGSQLLAAATPSLVYTPSLPSVISRTIFSKLNDVVSLFDYIPTALLTAIKAKTSTEDLTDYINDALTEARYVYVPPGRYGVGAAGLTVPAETSFVGAGDGVTEFFALGLSTNMLRLTEWSRAADMKIIGIYDPDPGDGGSGVLFQGPHNRAENITVQDIGFQGFAYNNGSTDCFQSNTRAIHCGHRGTNMSAGSKRNIIANYMAEQCGLAGLLMSGPMEDCRASNIIITGTTVEPSLWVTGNVEGCHFENITIRDPVAGAAAMVVQMNVQNCAFDNVNMYGVADRGLLIRGATVSNPELGQVNGPIQGNSFKHFRIFGTGVANGVKADIFDAQTITKNIFDDFYIDGCADGVDIDFAGISANEFRNFRFGTISNKKFRGGANANQYRTSRLFNFEGVSGIGSLALASNSLDAQPAVAATTVAVTNPFPIPVMVFISGLAGTTAVQINGTNVNSTLHDLGNGIYTLLPGQTIALTYSSGAPVWRWFAL